MKNPEQKIIEMMQNDNDINERTILKNLLSSQRDKVLIGLKYCKENFSGLDTSNCVKVINLLPNLL